MRKTRLALLQSVLALLLCCAMLIGTTFAWFTDSVTSGVNRISAGELDVELEYLDKNGNWKDVTETTNVFAEDTLWEPGHTEVVYLRISNQGSLALKYQLGINIVSETPSINVDGQPLILSEHIRFGVENNRDGKTAPWANRDAAIAAVSASAKALSTGHFEGGKLYPADNCPADGKTEQYIAMAVYMPESVGNEANYMTDENAPEIMLGIKLVATQQTSELDSFDSSYDAQTTFPPIQSGSISELFNVVNGLTAESRTMQGNGFAAEVPVGVKVTKELLTLSISEMAGSYSNIATASNELLRSLDVHMDGVAPDNTVPMKIMVNNAMMVGLNSGNFTLYHVENNGPVAMTAVNDIADLDVHNEFYYDPATGDVTLCMATFSEVALVADIENKWNGDIADAFAGGDGTEADPYLIANADQLAMFSAMVGGMTDRYEKNDFAGKFVKLLVNINLGGEENTNAGKIFYPIGYYNNTDSYTKTAGGSVSSSVSSFEGTFDGDGHKISNLYQNTWEMFGDYNDGYSGTPNHYKDAMGLFGYVMNGTVKNLTVDSFSSDGEFTPTGVIAAYAANATFENIAITNCNPRVYNTGNGGIIGIAGNSNDQGTLITLRNITVDNTNKITALWGSWDVACGGLVGMFRGNADGGNGKIHFENCHVSAQIDVNNDVCANYQYYQYRYAGMLIGSIRHNTTVDGRVRPNIAGISANNCTVHFGDWNDYYYCELVANTLASYTHDHQFSRLVQVASVDGTTITPLNGEAFTVPAEGRYNYVVVDGEHATENATCYHFVNGAVWNHEDAGTETVGGETVLKEDKQHYYLEFNNLFTGYGWGVNTYNIDTIQEFEGFTNLGNTNPESSVQKFYGNGITELAENSDIKVGTIFSALENSGVAIIPGALNVSITNVDAGNPVKAVFKRSADNWADSTIAFYGTGRVQITIQDYYFCKPTTIELDITANLIKNYNFDNGTANWAGSSVVSSYTEDAYSGNTSLKFVDDTADSAYNIWQKVPVEPGKTYVLTAWVKILEGSGGYIGVYDLTSETNTATGFSASIEGWQSYSTIVTIPEGYTTAKVEIGAHKSQVVTYLIDDVKFEEIDISTAVINGGFEYGSAYWTNHTQVTSSYAADKHSGRASLKFVDDSTSGYDIRQNVTVEPGKTYRLSAWVKLLEGSGGYIGIYGVDNAELESIGSPTDWTQIEMFITIPEGDTEAWIEIGTGTSAIVSFLIDDVEFVPCLFADFEDGSVIPDISVETWTERTHPNNAAAQGGVETILTTEGGTYKVGRGGNNKLVFQGAASSTAYYAKSPVFPVTGNTTYTVNYESFWAYNAATSATFELFFVDAAGNLLDNKSAPAFDSTAPAQTWSDVSLSAVAPAEATGAYIRFGYARAGSSYDYWIRNLCVIEGEAGVPGEPNLMPDSDFEQGAFGWLAAQIAEGEGRDGGAALLISLGNRGADISPSQQLALTPGKSYKLSFYARRDAADTKGHTVGYHFLFQDANGTYLGSNAITKSINPTTDWAKTEFEFTMPADAETLLFRFYLGGSSEATVYIDDISLVTIN